MSLIRKLLGKPHHSVYLFCLIMTHYFCKKIEVNQLEHLCLALDAISGVTQCGFLFGCYAQSIGLVCKYWYHVLEVFWYENNHCIISK